MFERVVTVAARAFLGLLALACAAGIAWGARGMIGDAFAAIAGPGSIAVIAAALAAGAVLVRAGLAPARLLERVPARVFAAAVFAIALGTAVWAHHAIHKGVPEVPDELGYLHQARTFAGGDLVAPSPPAPEFHYVSWGTHDDGKWYAVFPPGYGVLLAGGEAVGASGWVNPLLSALLAIVVWLLACELFGRDGAAARLAALVHVGSWFRLMNAGSFMSHPTAALLGALAILALWRGVIRRDRGPRARWWAVGGGTALAALTATRQLDAVIIAAVLAAAIAYALGRDLTADRARALVTGRLVALALAGFVPIFGGYLAYQRALTGDALLPPQQRYMQLKEKRGDCFRLGFGPGVGECPLTQNTSFGKDGFQPKHAVANTKRRLEAWTRWSFGWVPLALLPIVGLLGGAIAGGAQARRRALGAGVWVATVGGYALFFYHGVAYGARFYYVALPFAGLLFAAGCADIAGWVRRWRWGEHAAGALALALAALIVVGMVRDRAAVEQHAGKRPTMQGGKLAEVLRRPELRDALVFVDSMKIPAAVTEFPADVARNRPLVVKDLGDAANAGFARIYPDRRPVRLRGLTVTPVAFPPHAPMRHEGGSLYPLEWARGGFGQRVPAPWIGNVAASGGEALRFDVDGPGAFRLPVWAIREDAGAMVMTIGWVKNARGAAVRVKVDGVVVLERVDTRAAGWELGVTETPVTLAPGRHTVEVEVPEGAKGQIVVVDYVELRKT